jgi:hypothetical protein
VAGVLPNATSQPRVARNRSVFGQNDGKQELVRGLREIKATTHVAKDNRNRRSAIATTKSVRTQSASRRGN